MTPMTITVEDMRSKLLTIEQLTAMFQATEPLEEATFTPGRQQVEVEVSDAAMQRISDAEDVEANDVLPDTLIKVPGVGDFQVTVDALFEATSLFGMPRGYVKRCPAWLVQASLNHWFNHHTKDVKVLTRAEAVMAFTRHSIRPYSNLSLLEQVVEGIGMEYGARPEDLLVDYKLEHSLRKTHARIIVPERIRTIESARHSTENPDNWSVGVQMVNSLVGDEPTSLSGYMFAWWCTNGATTVFNSSGNWARRGSGDPSEVYEWARAAVDGILGGLEHELDQVQAMTAINLNGDVNDVMRDVFNTYRVPTGAREEIIASMVETDDLTAYGLHAAITAAANDEALSPGARMHLLEIGGEYPHRIARLCSECHRVKAG